MTAKEAFRVENVSDRRESDPNLGVRVKVIEDCDFPIEEVEVDGLKTLKIPLEILRYFDEEGYGAVRINSAKLAARLPNYGGSTAPGRSQTPHQDHLPADRRRFLAFCKSDEVPRGSSTYVMNPELGRRILPMLLEQFEAHREWLRDNFIYQPPYLATQEELYRCFEPGGIHRVVQARIGAGAPGDVRLFAYLGLITYLIQGELGDHLVEGILEKHEESVFVEDWSTPGILIVDNRRMLHGRAGPNVPIQRNWMVEE